MAVDASQDEAGSQEGEALGARFARELGRKDFRALAELLDSHIDFRGLTPGRHWEATDAGSVVDGILRRWFEETDEIDEVVSIETGRVADRQHVAYRFRLHNPDGRYEVEQQAYYAEDNGRINYMRVLCSGFRPC
jgi:hypothetical protein